MEQRPMKILILEDDIEECKELKRCADNREDIEIIGITDSDVEALKLTKLKHPEGIVLDVELNKSKTGSGDGLDFASKLKDLKLNFEPVIIVTTHINSDKTYEILHRTGVDLIIYKDQPKYCGDYVFNKFLNFRKDINITSVSEELQESQKQISDIIYEELNLVGINGKLKGKDYLHTAILYLIENEKLGDGANAIQYVEKVYKKPSSTITNGMQNAIKHGWRVTPIEDLTLYYKAQINYETGVPTPIQFIYYYRDKIKKMI